MARRCDVCGKGPVAGSNVSHAHNVTKRRFLPNVKKMWVLYEGKRRQMKVCTRCLRSGRVVKVA